MKGMKTTGKNEAFAIRRRALRLCGMERLSKEDTDKIVEACDHLVAVIDGVTEKEVANA